jgi:hypothetical protein
MMIRGHWVTWIEGGWSVVSEQQRPDPLAPPDGYGSRPGPSGYKGSGYPRPDRCVMESASGEACDHLMAVIIWWGDAAEHLYPLGYCPCHAALAQRTVRTHCTRCGLPNRIELAEDAGALGRPVADEVQKMLDWLSRG